MAVVLDSNPVPLEPGIPAAVNAVDAAGRSSPLGATILPGGVNFSRFCRGASDVELLFFDRTAAESVNFVTCHDGFTLNDLVSDDRKHNDANGAGDSDGANDNRSWNCGVEGSSDDPRGGDAATPAGKEFLDHHRALAGCSHDYDDDAVLRTQQRLRTAAGQF